VLFSRQPVFALLEIGLVFIEIDTAMLPPPENLGVPIADVSMGMHAFPFFVVSDAVGARGPLVPDNLHMAGQGRNPFLFKRCLVGRELRGPQFVPFCGLWMRRQFARGSANGKAVIFIAGFPRRFANRQKQGYGQHGRDLFCFHAAWLRWRSAR
jgi:hypothetical protein